ncbi:MAG: hypothetical protein ACREID_01330 [Planctomycetota bacterium]
MVSRRVLLLACLAFAACARTTMKASVADRLGAGGEMGEMDFWDELARERAVTNHDAIRALLLSAGKEAASWEERVKLARERAWVTGAGDPSPDETARVGWIARAVCLECGIKGGVTMRVFGPHPRYAARELAYRGWLPPMSSWQTLSGLKLIALLSQAEEFRSGKEGL